MVCGRDAPFLRSMSVKTRLRNLSPHRSSECWIRSMLHRSEPMPTIVTAPNSSGRVHQLAHVANAGVEAGEDRLTDQEVADVELRYLRNRRDRDDVVEREAMASVGLDAVLRRKSCAVAGPLQ